MLYMQSGEKFQCTDSLNRFDCILSDKNNFNIIENNNLCICLFVFWSLCSGHCVLVTVSQITGSSMELFFFGK